MSLWQSIVQRFSIVLGRRSQGKEQRYDNVQIMSASDGTIIKGHDAVKAYYEREKELYKAHGSSLIFQVYRINLQADTIEHLQSEKLAEIKVDGDFVSGDDTVAAVKRKLRSVLERKAWSQNGEEMQFDVQIGEDDRITLYFNGHPMKDGRAFYADNYIMLPAWVQVMIHRCEFEEVVQLIAKLRNN